MSHRRRSAFLAALVSIVVLAVVSACGGGSPKSGPNSVNCEDPNLPPDVYAANCAGTNAVPGGDPGPASAHVAYGDPEIMYGDQGSALLTVSTPVVKTYHESVPIDGCTANNPDDCYKPGKVVHTGVEVTVSWEGVDGTVDVLTPYEYAYEQPDGTLVEQNLGPGEAPTATIEKFDDLSSHPTTVTSGQKTHGQIAFASAVPGGKVIVTDTGVGARTEFGG